MVGIVFGLWFFCGFGLLLWGLSYLSDIIFGGFWGIVMVLSGWGLYHSSFFIRSYIISWVPDDSLSLFFIITPIILIGLVGVIFVLASSVARFSCCHGRKASLLCSYLFAYLWFDLIYLNYYNPSHEEGGEPIEHGFWPRSIKGVDLNSWSVLPLPFALIFIPYLVSLAFFNCPHWRKYIIHHVDDKWLRIKKTILHCLTFVTLYSCAIGAIYIFDQMTSKLEFQ
jgi:hypothetical protein